MTRGVAALMIIFFFGLTACSDKDSTPYGILPISKMSGIMWDMIQADQYAALLSKDSAHIDAGNEHLRLYEQVFRLHDVSREKFQKSYKYYLEHPELNQILSDSLSAYGNRLRSEAYTHPVARPAVTPVTTPATTPATAPPATPPNLFMPGRPLKSVIPEKGVPDKTIPGKGVPDKTPKTDTSFRNRIPHRGLTRPGGASSSPASLRVIP